MYFKVILKIIFYDFFFTNASELRSFLGRCRLSHIIIARFNRFLRNNNPKGLQGSQNHKWRPVFLFASYPLVTPRLPVPREVWSCMVQPFLQTIRYLLRDPLLPMFRFTVKF